MVHCALQCVIKNILSLSLSLYTHQQKPLDGCRKSPSGQETHESFPETQHMQSLHWNPFLFTAHNMQKLTVWAARSLEVQAPCIRLSASTCAMTTHSGRACTHILSCSKLHASTAERVLMGPVPTWLPVLLSLSSSFLVN